MEMSEADFAASFRPSGPVSVQDVLRRQLATPDLRELAEESAARAAAEADRERRETLQMLNAANGNPLAELSRAQQVAAAARDEVADLEARLAVARERFRSAAESVVDFGSAADEVLNASARRSSTPDLLAPAKQALAEQRVERMLAERSNRATRQVRSRRPFVGGVSRSESCQWCIDQDVSDHDSYLLHSDPEFDVPVTTPEQAQQQAEHAERRGHRGHAEISR
jgi:hypothetical protein